jgi:hypothetical protein
VRSFAHAISRRAHSVRIDLLFLFFSMKEKELTLTQFP